MCSSGGRIPVGNIICNGGCPGPAEVGVPELGGIGIRTPGGNPGGRDSVNPPSEDKQTVTVSIDVTLPLSYQMKPTILTVLLCWINLLFIIRG